MESPKDAAQELEVLHEARDIMEAGNQQWMLGLMVRWLGYIGDYTTQLYRDYNKPLYMDVGVDGSVGIWLQPLLSGGFKYLLFSSLPGEMIQFD